MSYVQSAASSAAQVTGVAGASLTGVTLGNGLVCFAVYQSATGSLTLNDSSGTGWVLWDSVTTGGITAAVFKTIGGANGGTHTVTASFTGGGGAWTYLFEDDSRFGYDNVQGQVLVAPGAGNTLVPGGTIGSVGETVYQIAVDISHGTTANYTPGYGVYHFVINVTGSDATAGRWRIAVDNTLGGTNPAMATGTSDATGADTYLLLAMAFQNLGMSLGVVNINQTVLVEEDVGPQRRSPYPLGMFFNRSVKTIPSTPLAYMSVKTPPWEFYRDPFVSVYSVLEVFSQISGTPLSPYVMRVVGAKQLPPPEEDYRRFDHGVYFQIARYYTAQIVGYTFDVPDLNSDPWIEWVHPPASPESALFVYRRQIVPANPYQFPIMWGQPRPWYVDGEQDSVYRKPDSGVLPYPRPIPPAVTMPNLIGLDEATAIGIILNLGLLFLGSVYEDEIYWQITPPTPWNPTGPFPPDTRGIVIGQWPLPGATVQPGSDEVTLYLSSGRDFAPGTGNSTTGNVPNTVIGSTKFP